MERGRNTGRRPARGQQDHAGDGHAQPRRDGGSQRRAHLHDRPLASRRPARSDCQGRGQDLHDRDTPRDAPTLTAHREHHLGDAVPFRRGRETLDERPVQQAGDRGGEKQEEPRRPSPHAVRLADVGRVLVEAGGDPRPRANRQVKDDGCRADDRANECGGHAEQGTMRGDRMADAQASPRSRFLWLRGLTKRYHRFAIST